MGQTVNLLRQRFGGSNPSAPTKQLCIVVAAPKGNCGNLVQVEQKLAFAVQCCQDSPKFAEFSCKPNAESLLYAEAPPKIATFPGENAEIAQLIEH